VLAGVDERLGHDLLRIVRHRFPGRDRVEAGEVGARPHGVGPQPAVRIETSRRPSGCRGRRRRRAAGARTPPGRSGQPDPAGGPTGWPCRSARCCSRWGNPCPRTGSALARSIHLNDRLCPGTTGRRIVHASHLDIAREPAGSRAGLGQRYSRAESGPSGYSSGYRCTVGSDCVVFGGPGASCGTGECLLPWPQRAARRGSVQAVKAIRLRLTATARASADVRAGAASMAAVTAVPSRASRTEQAAAASLVRW
jgi:hypothetical protein